MKEPTKTISNKTEAQIQRAMLLKLEGFGWYVIKLIQTNKNGIPDLLCHKDGRTVYIEVKRPRYCPAALQTLRMKQLNNAGVETFVMSDISELDKLNEA
jgi:Holliday junction resolvase